MMKMKKEHYLKQLDLKAEDLHLNILECAPLEFQMLKGLKNVQAIDPRQLADFRQPAQSFDLVLCSHHLFVEKHLTENDHINILFKLAGLGTEVRIYPVTDQEGKPSPYLGPMIKALQLKGFGVELRQVKIAEEGQGSDANAGHTGALLMLWQESCKLKENIRVNI